MSILGILSYIIVFSIFLLNSFKNLSGIISTNLFFASLLSCFGLFYYFSDIHKHYFFPILVALCLISYYTIIVTRQKKIESANLFMSAGQILLPIYLLTAQTLWEQLVIIALLESMNIVSSAGNTLKTSTTSIMNIININYKMFFLILTYSLIFMITGSSQIEEYSKITSEYIVLPISMLFIVSVIYGGGGNSQAVELQNIKRYKSKNILAYLYIYQFIIPFVFLIKIKELIQLISFDLFELVSTVLSVISMLILLIVIYRFYRATNWDLKLLLSKSIAFLSMNLLFIFSPKMSLMSYILYGGLLVLIYSMMCLGKQYKIQSKYKILFIASLFGLVTPLSPIFYFLVASIDGVETTNKSMIGIIIFISILILNFNFQNITKEMVKNTAGKNYNLFATQRVFYMGACVILTFIAIVYDKI